MKIYLEAFAGKLRSNLMDFPEGTGREIFLILDMDSEHIFGWHGEEEIPNKTRKTKCRFVANNSYVTINGYDAKVYVLVGID